MIREVLNYQLIGCPLMLWILLISVASGTFYLGYTLNKEEKRRKKIGELNSSMTEDFITLVFAVGILESIGTAFVVLITIFPWLW